MGVWGMLELLRGKSAIGGLQQTTAHDGYAIIDDRRRWGERLPWRWPRRRRVGDVALEQNAVPCGLVLDGPLLPPLQGAAREPFAFTIQDNPNGLTAGRAAVACQVAARASGVFVAARPIAQWSAKKV